MFNGIIFNTGKEINIKKNKNSIYVGIKTKIKFQKNDLGTSVCCDGVCLTIDKIVYVRVNKYGLPKGHGWMSKNNWDLKKEIGGEVVKES